MNLAKNSSPTRSRDKILQTLYELEVGGQDLDTVLKNFSSEKSNPFYQKILKGVVNKNKEIDKILEDNIERPLDQVDLIEKNILRIALYELMDKQLDSLIVISESIRMSKKYGSVEGYKLINAVLDRISKENQI
jgi:N utilization substance protein B